MTKSRLEEQFGEYGMLTERQKNKLKRRVLKEYYSNKRKYNAQDIKDLFNQTDIPQEIISKELSVIVKNDKYFSNPKNDIKFVLPPPVEVDERLRNICSTYYQPYKIRKKKPIKYDEGKELLKDLLKGGIGLVAIIIGIASCIYAQFPYSFTLEHHTGTNQTTEFIKDK